jgi:mannosyltransferase OCH1-like enzyme
MQHGIDSPEHHRNRSEFIRQLVQRSPARSYKQAGLRKLPPKKIIQFWHDLENLPLDVDECIRSWADRARSGFEHRLFDTQSAAEFILCSLGIRHRQAFDRCYHPAMKSDYFRLCYVLIQGGIYVDADDVCLSADIEWMVEDGRLKLQPLCYDVSSNSMVPPAVFLSAGAHNPNWICYFNNNPLIAGPEHPIVEQALRQATIFLELGEAGEFPEIQMATGPGNLSKAVFELGSDSQFDIESELLVVNDWESVAISKWPLSYREDSRNWRLSNQIKFDRWV